MQDLTTVRSLLASVGARPSKALGQCFLVDLNKMQQVLEMADIPAGRSILEVGPGTGSLTEELLARAEEGSSPSNWIAPWPACFARDSPSPSPTAN